MSTIQAGINRIVIMKGSKMTREKELEYYRKAEQMLLGQCQVTNQYFQESKRHVYVYDATCKKCNTVEQIPVVMYTTPYLWVLFVQPEWFGNPIIMYISDPPKSKWNDYATHKEFITSSVLHLLPSHCK
jgi:hypothetical protein